MRNSILVIILIIFFGCKSKQSSLELSIINNEVYAYCPDTECINVERFNENGLYDKYINKVKFKIKNNTNRSYLLMPICINKELGCITNDAFPHLFSGLSLNNLIIEDNNKNKIISTSYSFHDTDYQLKTDEQITLFYKKLGINYNEAKLRLRGLSQKKTIIIPANETIYFESYITLPFNKPSINSSPREAVSLDKEKAYTVRLIFTGDKKLIEKRLTNAQKETIKFNNYKIFDGELISTNSVPIIFKD